MVDHAAHPTPQKPRLALAHDWLVAWRGGERVLERIAAVAKRDLHAQPGPLSTMFASEGEDWRAALGCAAVHTSPLNRLPAAFRRWLLPAYPWAVGRLSHVLARAHKKRPVDLVVSTHSAAIKAIRPPAGVPHLCYCHTPARYLWSQGDEYARGSLGVRTGLALFGPMLRNWDRATASRVTTFVANSAQTAELIRTAYARESTVIHPPVRTCYFTPAPVPREDFWLVVSALEPYKRVDLAIEAAAATGTRLLIAGEGSQRQSLSRLALERQAPVEFLGRVDDGRLRGLYRTARALLFPQVEDFGIVAVEAQACGCPVVARGLGGATETVRDTETGAFFADPTPEALAAAAAACPDAASTACADACRMNAERFGEDVFDRAIAAAMAGLLA